MFEGNYSGNSGAALFQQTGLALVQNSTFISNTVVFYGGGIAGYASTVVTNSTFTANSGSRGGAVFSGGPGGAVRLTNVTLNRNNGGQGGGLAASSPITLQNTIVANSTTGGNCADSGIKSLGFNISSDDTCALGANGDLTNTNPQLGPLGYYGGALAGAALSVPGSPTQRPLLTFMPLPGSPAIDAGSCPGGIPATDQRGAPRPVGTACDIGAVEYGALLPWLYLPLVVR